MFRLLEREQRSGHEKGGKKEGEKKVRNFIELLCARCCTSHYQIPPLIRWQYHKAGISPIFTDKKRVLRIKWFDQSDTGSKVESYQFDRFIKNWVSCPLLNLYACSCQIQTDSHQCTQTLIIDHQDKATKGITYFINMVLLILLIYQQHLIDPML